MKKTYVLLFKSCLLGGLTVGLLASSAFIVNKIFIGDSIRSLSYQALGILVGLVPISVISSLLICLPVLILLTKLNLTTRPQLSLIGAAVTGGIAILLNEYGGLVLPLFGLLLGLSSGLFAHRGMHARG